MQAGPSQNGSVSLRPAAKKRRCPARNQTVFYLLISLYLICLVVCPLDPSWNNIGVDDARQVTLVSGTDSPSAIVPADFHSAVPPEIGDLPGHHRAVAIVESGLLCFPTWLHQPAVELQPLRPFQFLLSLRLQGRAPPSFLI